MLCQFYFIQFHVNNVLFIYFILFYLIYSVLVDGG